MTDPYSAPEWYDPGSLVRRLNGIYATPINDGLGPLEGEQIIDGHPHHVRTFDNRPEVQIRAAKMIENLESDLEVSVSDIQDLIEELKIPADPMGIGRTFIVPIHREAIARLQEFIPS